MAVAIGGNVYKYFDNEKFSDVTVKMNGEDIKAHKLILAQGSDYFRACFDGGFQESRGGIIWLYGDDTFAFKCLIQHMYGYSYGNYSEQKIQEDAKNAKNIEPFVALYVVGQKYLVPQACVEAKTTFVALLDRIPHTEKYIETFTKVVKHVYVDYVEEATDLRGLLVTHFVEHGQACCRTDDFKPLFGQVPDFAFEVMDTMIQQEKTADIMATKGATAKKRKR